MFELGAKYPVKPNYNLAIRHSESNEVLNEFTTFIGHRLMKGLNIQWIIIIEKKVRFLSILQFCFMNLDFGSGNANKNLPIWNLCIGIRFA